MAQTDRNAGLVAEAAFKNPVKAATTANITLSGEQTVDGVALVANDRCLVKDQTDSTENGLYEVSTGAWTRTKDFNGAYDAVQGTTVWVNSGTSNGSNFWYVSTADTVDIGTDAITFTAGFPSDASSALVTATGSTTARTLANRFGEIFNVKDYGAAGDNVADDSAAIRAAAAALGTNGGGILYFPKGIYRYDGTVCDITAGGTILGDGPSSTQIRLTGTSADVFRITDGGTRGWRISGFNFFTEQVTTTGEVIDVIDSTSNSQDAVISHCSWRNSNRFVRGIFLRAGTQGVYMHDLIMKADFAQAIRIDNSNNNYLSDFVIDGQGTADVGIQLNGTTAGGGVEAFMAARGIVANCDTALETTGTSAVRGNGVFGCKFTDIYFDDAKVDDSAKLAEVSNSVFSGCSFLSAARYGCWVGGKNNGVANNLYFVNCHFDKNVSHGLRVESTCNSVRVIGGSAKDNNDLSGGTQVDGILLESGCTGITIKGVDCRGQVSDVFNKPQDVGIDIGVSCDNFVIEGCDVRGNTDNGIVNSAGYSSTKIVRNNIGWVTENSGSDSGVAPDANGNDTIAHGLAATPAFVQVGIRGDNVNGVDVQSVDGTNITVRIKDAAGADVTAGTFTVDWVAKL